MTLIRRILQQLGAVILVVGLLISIFGVVQVLHESGITARFSVGGGLAVLGLGLVGLSGSFRAMRTGAWRHADPVSQIVGLGFLVGGLALAVTSDVDYAIITWAVSVMVLMGLELLGVIGHRR